ncbi:hypothetical protein [Streptomyces sp. NRRL F-5123]|uniref:hypothetical protein n=1 Tax=Streptomyces sp. NRRL F-5123 TaxID=1463856 RepID=UPI0004E1CA20|nr:hypothetical protein [Streptomyces sp. NRRL F-5123]
MPDHETAPGTAAHRGAPSAALPGAARRCDHCGRTTTEWAVRERADDRGPVELVWCRDARSCGTARRAIRTRPRTWGR